MKAKLYIPYFGYSDSFDADGVYKTENDYIKAMEDAYNSTKDVITSMMSDGVVKNYSGLDGATYSFGKQESKSEKILYAPCDAVLVNESGKDEDIDGIITHFAKGDEFFEDIALDIDNASDDFQSEFFMWVNEHQSVLKNGAELGDAWCWQHQPKRELKLEFKNLAGETVYASLAGCKIWSMKQKNQPSIYIEKLDLIDRI